MLAKLKLFGAATLAGGALAAGIAAPGASAQGPIVTGGLVNVTVADVLNNNTVQVPLGVGLNLAANVCGVSVNVLSRQLSAGDPTCTNGDQTVTITPTATA